MRADYDPIPNLSPAEAQAVRSRNLEKIWTTCLKCGRRMFTERGKRVCARCHGHDHDGEERRA